MNQTHIKKGHLHGITVVVDTFGPSVFIGRYFEERTEGLLLLDADEYIEGKNGQTKNEFINGAAKNGQWKSLDKVIVPHSSVKSLNRLLDFV